MKKSKKVNANAKMTAFLEEIIEKELDAFVKSFEWMIVLKRLEKQLNKNTIESKFRELGIACLLISTEELEEMQKFLNRNTIETKLRQKEIDYCPVFKNSKVHTATISKLSVYDSCPNKIKIKKLGNKKQEEIFRDVRKQADKAGDEMIKELYDTEEEYFMDFPLERQN